MKTLSFILIALLGLSCSQHSSKKSTQSNSSKTYIKALQKRKALIDRLPKKDTSALMVFVKMDNKSELMRIFNGNFPEDSIEYTYNVLTDKGKVIMVMCSPFSESGDWDIDYVHYFDDNGDTYCFERNESIFDDDVKGGIVRERLTKYYEAGFKIIGTENKLMDENFKPLHKTRDLFNFRDYPYKIYEDVNDCLNAYSIRL